MEKNEKRLVLSSDDDFDEQFKDQDTAPKKEEEEVPQKPWQIVLEYVRVVAIGAVIALLLSRFVIINAVVPSGSMIPTIERRDRLIGLRMTYYFTDPKRGDVAIFVTPDPTAEKGELYIKRVIGLPGETVTVSGSQVIITTAEGEVLYLNEPYIKQETYSENYLTANKNNQTIYLHYKGELDENGELLLDKDGKPYEDQFFMMGDNRGNSNDSRDWGPVKRSAVKAKALFKYYSGFSQIK